MAKILTLLLVCFSAFGQTLSVINTGTTPNDGTGDSLRTAFTKANTNFYQLWSEVFTNIPVDIANATNIAGSKIAITNGTAVNLTGSLTNATANGIDLRASIPVGSLVTATILGDSITQGSAASASGTRWHQLVTGSAGWAGTQIGAWGGARIEDIAWQAMPGIIVTNSDYSPTTIYTSPTNITEDDVLLALVGYNDQRGGGTDATRRTHFRNTLRHIAAWWALTAKTFAQDADAETGTWSDLPFYSGTVGRTSPSGSGSITFSNIIGDAIYLGYQANQAGAASFTVTVDGRSVGSFANGPTFANAAAFAPPYVGPNGDGTIDENPWCLRVAGLGMSAHTVTVTITTGTVSVLWCGGNAPNYNSQKGPLVLIGNTLRSTAAGYNSGSDAGVALYNLAINQVTDELRSDGLKVIAVDASARFDPVTGMSGDNVHPNDTGHAQIADAFTDALATDYQRSKAVENRRALDQLFTQDNTSLTLRVPNSANNGDRTFTWNGGALPFRSATYNSPTATGSFDYASGNSAHSSGTIRFADYEHTLSESGTAGSVGMSFRTYITSVGSGSHYPLLINTSEGTNNWSNLRLDIYGDALVEAKSTSGGRTWYFRDPNATASQIHLQYGNTALDRRLLLTGNSVIAYNTAGTAQNLALGASGVNVAVQGGLTVAQSATVTGRSTLSGGLALAGAGITSSTTLTTANTVVFVNDATGDVTVSLPTAVGIDGQMFVIKKTGGANTTTIDPDGSETIDGFTTVTVGSGQAVVLESNGTEWKVVAGVGWTYPQTALVYSGTTVTLTSLGGDTQINTLTCTNDCSLAFANLAPNSGGTILVWPAATNCTVTLPSYAYGPSGTTLTITGGTGYTNHTEIAWKNLVVGGTNRVSINALNYYR